MEDPSKTTDSVTISASVSSDIAQLRHQPSVPDVPEDIEDDVTLHFNDPNWDFQDNFSTLSISTDGAESQRISKISSRIGAGTEVNTVSHIPSWHIYDPKADFSFKEQLQLRVLSLPSCVASFYSPSSSSSSGIHRTLRSGQPSRTPMTQQCPRTLFECKPVHFAEGAWLFIDPVAGGFLVCFSPLPYLPSTPSLRCDVCGSYIHYDLLDSISCSPLCPHLRHFFSARCAPIGQAPRVDSSKVSYFRLRLLVFLESRAVQHKGTHSYRDHGQRRGRGCPDHRCCHCDAHRLWYPVVDRQEIPPGLPYSGIRLLFGWHPPPVSRLALEHDLAGRPGSLLTAKRHSFELRKERHEAHLKRALLLSCVSMQLCVVLGPGVSMDRTERVQLGLLDFSE